MRAHKLNGSVCPTMDQAYDPEGQPRRSFDNSVHALKPPTSYCNDWGGMGMNEPPPCDNCKDGCNEADICTEKSCKGLLTTCSQYCMARLKKELLIV